MSFTNSCASLNVCHSFNKILKSVEIGRVVGEIRNTVCKVSSKHLDHGRDQINEIADYYS